MSEIDAASAKLVIASPPYTNNPDGKTLRKSEYKHFIRRVFDECYRILKPGCFLVTINTDLRDHARYNAGDTRFNGLVWHKHSTLRETAEAAGFLCMETKIWAKSLKRNAYRYNFSYILFFSKPGAQIRPRGRPRAAQEFNTDIWLLEGGTYRRDSRGYVFRDAIHPAVVSRVLTRFTSRGDLVISPFAGSGTILAVATRMGRPSIGYEINRELRHMIQTSITSPSSFSAYQTLVASPESPR